MIFGVGIFFTNLGQMIVNSVFPDPERTIRLLVQESKDIDNSQDKYIFEHSDGEILEVNNVTGVGYVFDVAFSPELVSSSTTIPEGTINRRVIFNGGDVLIQDLFVETFVPIQESYLDEVSIDFINKIVSMLTDVDITSTQFSTAVRSGNLITLHGSGTGGNAIKVSVRIPNHRLNSIDISNLDGDVLRVETNNESEGNINFANPVVVTEFGDLMARESVLIRTQAEGKYDNLWHKWEEKVFSCYRCVGSRIDSDGDGIDNETEFMFATDPLVSDTIPDHYPSSLRDLFTSEESENQPKRRDGYGLFNLTIPNNARAFSFLYVIKSSGGEPSYLSIFLGKELVAIINDTEPDVLTKFAIPLELRVATTTMSVIYNSTGVAKANMQLQDMKFITSSYYGEALEQALEDESYTILRPPITVKNDYVRYSSSGEPELVAGLFPESFGAYKLVDKKFTSSSLVLSYTNGERTLEVSLSNKPLGEAMMFSESFLRQLSAPKQSQYGTLIYTPAGGAHWISNDQFYGVSVSESYESVMQNLDRGYEVYMGEREEDADYKYAFDEMMNWFVSEFPVDEAETARIYSLDQQ